MAGGGKGGDGGGGSSLHDYSGTIAGAFCAGMTERLISFIVDGEEVWPAAPNWVSGFGIAVNDLRFNRGRTWICTTPHTSAADKEPPNSSYWAPYFLARSGSLTVISVPGRGTIKWHWGTMVGTVDPLLLSSGNSGGEEHPAFLGITHFVFEQFLFGRERVSAPNVEAVIEVEAEQSIVTGASALLVDGQVNPVTAIAMLLTHPTSGLSYASSMIDSTSFQSAADSAANFKLLCYCSILIDTQETVRSAISRICEDFDVWLRWNPDTKKIECGRFTHGIAPASYTALSINDFIKKPVIPSGSLDDIKTGCTVIFNDQERQYKQSSETFEDPRLVSMIDDSRVEVIQIPSITRREQAMAYAIERTRITGTPQMSTNRAQVRREKGRSIKPGDYVQIDIDSEPGGVQLLQFFRVMRSTLTPEMVTLDLRADTTLTPVGYDPSAIDSPTVHDDSVPALPYPRVLEVGSGFNGDPDALLFLAERQNAFMTGFRVWFNTTGSGSFNMISDQHGYAIRVGVAVAIDATNPTPNCRIFMSTTSVDTPEFLATPITPEAAADDTYLLILMALSGPDVALDSDGRSKVEVFSISGATVFNPVAWASGVAYAYAAYVIDAGVRYSCLIAHTSSGANRPPNLTYWLQISATDFVVDLTTIRSRMGTYPRAFTWGEAWICRRDLLSVVSHGQFPILRQNRAFGLIPDTAYFRVQPYTPQNELSVASISNVAFQFGTISLDTPDIILTSPAWTAQTYSSGAWPVTISIQGTVADRSGKLAEVIVAVKVSGGDETVIYRSPAGKTNHPFAVSHTISAAGTYTYIIRAVTDRGLRFDRSITAIALATATKLPIPQVNFIGTYYAPPPYNFGGTGLAAARSTMPRDHWNYTTLRFAQYGYSPDILTTGGSILIAATAPGVTVAPASGWIACPSIAYGQPVYGFYSWLNASSLPVYPPAAGSPRDTINAAYPSNAPFKLWWKASNPGNTDSDPEWMIFSG